MSIKEKEFIKAIQSAKAERDVVIGLRKLGEAHIKRLKYKHGLYSKNAIKDIEKSIIRKYRDIEVPAELHNMMLEVSRYYSRNEMFQKAEQTLDKIINSRNISIMIQAQYEKNLIQLKRGLNNGEVNQEIIDDIKDTVRKDLENELETAKTGELSDFDIFRSYFGDRIPVKDISAEIFPLNMRKPRNPRNNVEPIDPTPVPNNGAYDEKLSANNRLKFLMENFDIEFASTGYGKFTGAIMFEIRNSNLVIVENFWKRGKSGEPPIEDYGKATYILPKDSAMDLIGLERGEIKARRHNDKSIPPPTSHTLNYYQTLIDRFNEAQKAQFEKVEPHYIPTSDEQSEVPVVPTVENPQLEDETPTVEPSKEETPKVSNEEFLNMLNENIGGLITTQMMEEFLIRTGYSLNDLYNKRLKYEIAERLNILEIPEDELEKETQKVFLYIRIAKKMSLINSHAINREKLSGVLDDSVIEYSKAMEFLELHKGDGLAFRELRKQLIKYVDLEPIIIPEPKKNEESITPTIIPEEPTPVAENEENQQGEDKLDSLFNGIQLPKEVKLGAMNLITRYLELLARCEELEAENQRVDQQLSEELEQQEMRRQETLKAQEQERLARLATEAAIEQESAANKKVEETQKEKDRLQKEREELKKKISNIQDALR